MWGAGVGVTQRCWMVLGCEGGSCACITSHCRGSECTKGCYTSRGVPAPQGVPFSRGVPLPPVSHFQRGFPFPEEFPTSRGVLCMAQFLLPSHRGWLHTRYKAVTPSRWRHSTGKALFVSLDPFLPKTSVLVGNQTP